MSGTTAAKTNHLAIMLLANKFVVCRSASKGRKLFWKTKSPLYVMVAVTVNGGDGSRGTNDGEIWEVCEDVPLAIRQRFESWDIFDLWRNTLCTF
jgi:hypothetical protein